LHVSPVKESSVENKTMAESRQYEEEKTGSKKPTHYRCCSIIFQLKIRLSTTANLLPYNWALFFNTSLGSWSFRQRVSLPMLGL